MASKLASREFSCELAVHALAVSSNSSPGKVKAAGRQTHNDTENIPVIQLRFKQTINFIFTWRLYITQNAMYHISYVQ